MSLTLNTVILNAQFLLFASQSYFRFLGLGKVFHNPPDAFQHNANGQKK